MFFTACLLTACGNPRHSAQTVAGQSIQNVGCKVSQSDMWTSLQKVVEDGEAFPADADLRAALVRAGQAKGLSGPAFEKYVDAFLRNYRTTIDGIKSRLAPTDVPGWKKALAEMELGVRVTPVHAELQDRIQASLKTLKAAEQALNVTCPSEPGTAGPNPIGVEGGHAPATIWDQLKAQQTPEIYGARRVLAVAYQSCGVLNLPAMTAATPDVSGITILAGRHPAGGLRRAIGNLASVDASHYYIKNQTLPKNSCFEVRNSPMIYDFGGKPYTSASHPELLDFFRNGGSGESVLGIDCSAFVFSALAAAGLKMDPDPQKVLKASLVNGISSSAFKEPQSNGLRCLKKITVSKDKSVMSGDIVAISGHVVMIDSAGDDPFGLNAIKSATDCTAAKLSYRDFDFVIAQSSPSKSGIGINRYAARDYLAESATIRNGLTAYALAACRAKFGLAPQLNSPSLSVVRHLKTPECMTTALAMNHEDCVDSCRPL